MIDIMQAKCPGCQNLLRIPAGWMDKPIRCKHCGMVVQAAPKAPPISPGYMPAPAYGQPGHPYPIQPTAQPSRMPDAPLAKPIKPKVDRGSPRQKAAFLAVWFLGLVALIGAVYAAAHRPQEIENDDKVAVADEAKDKDAPPPPPPPPPPKDKLPTKDKDKNQSKDKDALKDKDKAKDAGPPKDKDKAKDTGAPKDKDKPPPKDNGSPKDKDKPPPRDGGLPKDGGLSKDKDKDGGLKDKDKDKPPPPRDKRDGFKDGTTVIPPRDNGSNKDGSKDGDVPPPIPRDAIYPRRLMIVSVSNYLYYNPVTYGAKGYDLNRLKDLMQRQFNIAPTQVLELSDGAPGSQARPPVLQLMEGKIEEFLVTSRPQDRIILMFSGHTFEDDRDAYLIPMDGEIGDTDTMMSVTKLLDMLDKCKARQKLLIIDCCRIDPTRGTERPLGGRDADGKMGTKLADLLKKQRPNVQIWASCSEGEHSYEESVTVQSSIFLDRLLKSIDPNPGVEEKRVNFGIQHPTKPIPLKDLVTKVNAETTNLVSALYRGASQKPFFTGSFEDAAGGTPYDPREKIPDKIDIDLSKIFFSGAAKPTFIQAILDETEEIPPVKVRNEAVAKLRAETMPFFSDAKLRPYGKDGGPEGEFRMSVVKASETLKKHATSFTEVFRGDLVKIQEILNRKDEQERLARAGLDLEEAIDAMEAAAEKRGEEKSKRWLANFDYVRARLLARYAYVQEYNHMLGEMRQGKVPEKGPKDNGWRLASRKKLSSTGDAKKYAKQAEDILKKIATDHAGTPWEVLAKRELSTSLGLEWMPTR